MNSLDHPADINEREYAYGENVVNRGGLVQTRPGYRLKVTMPGKKLQGLAMFRPTGGLPRAVAVIDGIVYAAKPPHATFSRVQGISFSPTAPVVVMQRCTKSVKLNPDGSLTILPAPVELLVFQDNVGPAAYWDGATARHLKPESPFLETPSGLWMAWSGSRLWISRGSRVYASDLADPLSFAEDTYLAERSAFEMSAEVTGLIETIDRQSLLAFTADNTSALQSGIIDRTQWALTPEFQKIILPDLGCVSGLSPVSQYGGTFWYSRRGWVSLDSALFSEQTSRIVSLDQKMMRSKRNLYPRQDKVCSIAFENYLLCSMPSGDKHNSHTWVMDQAPVDDRANFCWSSVWSGVRPVQWAKAITNGRERLFFGSYGRKQRNGHLIHLWEAFMPDRKDDRGRILCQMESRAVSFPEKAVFRYAELDLAEIAGQVHLIGYVGGIRGGWHKVLDKKMQASAGSLKWDRIIHHDEILKTHKPQHRIIRTETLIPQDRPDSMDSEDVAGVDKGFQLLLQWRGRMGVRGIRMVCEDATEAKSVGRAEDAEERNNVLTERGENA